MLPINLAQASKGSDLTLKAVRVVAFADSELCGALNHISLADIASDLPLKTKLFEEIIFFFRRTIYSFIGCSLHKVLIINDIDDF
jgi:hypothetical protein